MDCGQFIQSGLLLAADRVVEPKLTDHPQKHPLALAKLPLQGVVHCAVREDHRDEVINAPVDADGAPCVDGLSRMHVQDADPRSVRREVALVSP
jgi:hypothetical protein